MQIAFIHPRFPSAQGTGATYSATQIVKGLANRGHEICVYCTQSPDENSKMPGIETQYLNGNSRHLHTDTRLNREIKSRIDEFREYDIVHSYLMPLIPSIAEIGKFPGVGTVVTLNAYKGICAKNDLLYRNQQNCRSKSISKCINCIIRTGYKNNENGYLYQTASQLLSLPLICSGEHDLDYIDGFHALSTHLKNIYTEFGYQDGKIDVIPNILDSKFDVNHQSNFNEPYKLLYVGYLKQSKGADRLIEIFSYIRKKSSKDIKLTIIGDGDLINKLETQIIDRNLSEDVDLRGRVPNRELPQIYANHDIFVYPGRWDEPFGRIFLEAMAAGTPIVSTDVGSVQNIIGNSGICTGQSSRMLADAIFSVLNEDTLNKYSEAGKQRIDRYRVDKIIPQFETLYARAISRSRK